MFDGDMPPGRGGRSAGRRKVAPDADESAAGAAGEELGDDHVGGQALADPAGVETDAGGHDHGRRRRVDRHVGDGAPGDRRRPPSGSSLLEPSMLVE